MKPGLMLTAATIGSVVLEGITAFAALGLVTAILTGGRFVGPTILTTVTVALASFGISRAMQHVDMDERRVRRWAIGISALLFYILMRAEFAGDVFLWDLTWLGDLLGGIGTSIARRPDIFIGAFGLLLLWVRGVIIGQLSMNFETFLFPFSFGLIATAIAATFAESAGARDSLKLMPIFSVSLGLTVLALAHIARVESGPSQGFGRSWGPVLIVTLALLVSLTAVFAVLDFGGVRELVSPIAAAILWVLNGIFLVLTFVIVYPIYWLLRGIVFVLGLVVSSEALDRFGQMLDERESQQRELQTPQLPGIFLILERLIVILVIAGAVGFGIYWLMRRYLHGRRVTDGDRESVYERGSLGEDMNAMLKSLLGRFRRERRPRPAFRGGITSIRQLYLRMLFNAADDGLSRPPATTPLEFSPPLVSHYRDNAPAAISDAFAAARYGRRFPSRRDVGRLATAWRAIRRRKE